MERKDDPELIPRDGWQTPQRGSLEEEYAIYTAAMRSAGDTPKTFEEWLSS